MTFEIHLIGGALDGQIILSPRLYFFLNYPAGIYHSKSEDPEDDVEMLNEDTAKINLYLKRD